MGFYPFNINIFYVLESQNGIPPKIPETFELQDREQNQLGVSNTSLRSTSKSRFHQNRPTHTSNLWNAFSDKDTSIQMLITIQHLKCKEPMHEIEIA